MFDITFTFMIKLNHVCTVCVNGISKLNHKNKIFRSSFKKIVSIYTVIDLIGARGAYINLFSTTI